MDWDEAQRKTANDRKLGEPLDRLAIRELEEYLAALKLEIERTEAELKRKRLHEAAAQNLFKRSS